MPPVKQCRQCGSMMAIKKLVCVFGHLFKRNLPVYATRKSKRVAMQLKRALESADETVLRQTKDSTSKAQKRALETEEQSLQRKQSEREQQKRQLKLCVDKSTIEDIKPKQEP